MRVDAEVPQSADLLIQKLGCPFQSLGRVLPPDGKRLVQRRLQVVGLHVGLLGLEHLFGPAIRKRR